MKSKFAGWVLGALLAGPVHATVISIQPLDVTVAPGDTFSLNINVRDAIDLYAVHFDLRFNSTVMSAVSVFEGAELQSGGPTTFSSGVIDNAAGKISFISNSLIGAVPGVAGAGTLMSVQFHAFADDYNVDSVVDFVNEVLLDSNLQEIPHGSQPAVASVYIVPEPNSGALLFAGLGLGIFTRCFRRRVVERGVVARRVKIWN
ncbi:MAG: cohesin domain-containing protein [Pseudomonadota bacterium]